MKKYIGKKTIMAKPMAKSEAEKVLNRAGGMHICVK